VIVVNYPPRVRERLNLSYEHISAINPRAMYTDLTGYGERGPDANETSFDITAYWARSGLMDVTRNASCPRALSVLGMGDQATGMRLYACAGYMGHPFVEIDEFRERMSHVASTPFDASSGSREGFHCVKS
jgi:crotonobetainyl-CoA:carnitine CoA-transferase CaiB-like acyl-CoA transferase